jgi:sulfur-carrier protein
MKINFFATLRPIVGQKTVDFELPENVTVRQLVEVVVTRFPPLRKELLDADGELYGHVHVFINGRDAPYLDQRMETVVMIDDTVNIFPAVGGGSGMKVEEVHSIPLWLLREYLEEIGGTAVNDNRIEGKGWTVTLTKLEPKKIGSLRIGQVKLEIAGDTEAIATMKQAFNQKTMRAGG